MVSTVQFKDIAPTLDHATPAALRGHFDKIARDLLARLEGHAASVPDGPVRSHLFTSLAVSHHRAGDSAKAGKLVNRALNNAEKIVDPAGRIEALSSVAVVLHQGGLDEGAVDALTRAQAIADGMDRDARGDALLMVATAFDRTGRSSCGVEALRRALPTAAPVVPTAEEALPELEPIDEMVEALELEAVEPVVEPARQASAERAPAEGASSKPWQAPRKDEIDEGEFVDPFAGVKFPGRKSKRAAR